MTKIVFNDATEMQAQSMVESDGRLEIKMIAATLDQIRTKFSDALATKRLQVYEQGRIIAEYVDYTVLYRLEEYTGGIRGVVMYKASETPEAKAEVQNASILAAQILAQNFDDAQALQVQALYPEWSGNGVNYAAGRKVQYNGILYKVNEGQGHISQPDWPPDTATALFSKVLIPDPDVIPEWEQPDSTNPYSEGDKVTHDGKTWVSTANNNVWEPGVYGWDEVTE